VKPALLALAALGATASGLPTPVVASPPPPLVAEPFVLLTVDGGRHAASLERLRVPEDRGREGSPPIMVSFVRLSCTTANPGPPIVFLSGEADVPSTLLGRVPAYYALFERLRELGDVILLDRRGTGLSEPTLQCAAKRSLPLDAFESEAKAAAALGEMARACVRMVRRDGHAPEAYHSDASADDLEDLRVALGADRLRLLAMGDGTETALAAVRRHGDRIERVVLAGTRGPDHVWTLPRALDLQLKGLSRLVAQDSTYANELPDLEGAVRRILDTLAWRTASVEVTDLKSKKEVRLRVGPFGLQAAITSDLSDGFAARALPAMVATLARGDSLLFARRMERLYNDAGFGVSVAGIATDCASGGSPERIARATEEGKAALLGAASTLLLSPAFCDLVGSPDLGAAARAPIRSETPALFITGEYDGVTPPAQAEEVRMGFPNGVALVAANGWHEMLSEPEVGDVVAEFFRGADVHGRRIALAPARFLSVEEAKAAATKLTQGK